MLFSSLTFLTIFLPSVIIIYFLMPNRGLKNACLLIFSLIFYAWGEPIYILWMLFLVTYNYFVALIISSYKQTNQLATRVLFIISIGVNLSGLLFFKYINFIIENINILFSFNVEPIHILMPLGISFYTFQIVSYLIDVYFEKTKAQEKWYLLLTYLSFFPQLIAGPIVRYQTIAHELTLRKETWQNAYDGISRFIIGLGKKIIIANNIAIVSNYVFSLFPYEKLNFSLVWVGVLAFTFQIYFDFSAYSDMAIGLGKLFGFNFLENFNYPYLATSITDFWRRWHISLSTWFRDYVYIPLGGNKRSWLRNNLNLFIVWFLTGLWHGASWNFVVWGLYFAFLLFIERAVLLRWLPKLVIVNRIYTLLFVVLGWVLFNADNLTHASYIFFRMLDFNSGINLQSLQFAFITYTWPYFILAFVSSTDYFSKLLTRLNTSVFGKLVVMFYLMIVLLLSVMFLVNDSFNPFIYFRF